MDMNGHDVLDDCAEDVPTLAQKIFGGFRGYSGFFWGCYGILRHPKLYLPVYTNHFLLRIGLMNSASVII